MIKKYWTNTPCDGSEAYFIESHIDSRDFIKQLHQYQYGIYNLSINELHDILSECIDFINDMQDELDEVVRINNNNVDY